jgi:hypothetical protein
MITILYALVGIPLTFLYLSNIGNFLADCFRLFYKRICCDVCCCQKCERQQKRQKLKLRQRREYITAAAAQRNVRLVSRTHVNNSNAANMVTVRRRAISAQTIPKARVSSVVSPLKPEVPNLRNRNELLPEAAYKRRSPKASVGSGGESTISGPPSSTATTALTSVSKNESMRETDILRNESLSSRHRLLVGVPDNDVTCGIVPKRPRLEQAAHEDYNELEEEHQQMLIDFINSKETDLVGDICGTSTGLLEVTRLPSNSSLGDHQRQQQQLQLQPVGIASLRLTRCH